MTTRALLRLHWKRLLLGLGGLVGLVLQLWLLWAANELVGLCLSLMEVWAELARKHLEIIS